MRVEIVTSSAPLGEGPVWCPDGTLVITSISPGGLRRIQPESGEVETISSFPGGGNSAQLASDGGFILTNSGCIDFTQWADALGLDAEAIPYTPGPPGLQRIRPDGEIEVLASEGLQAPNDLIVAADSTVFFTDPPPNGGTQSKGGEGRLWSYSPRGELQLLADGFDYDNGIALSPEQRLLIVEARRTLFTTELAPGRVCAIEGLPTPGLALNVWPVPR